MDQGKQTFKVLFGDTLLTVEVGTLAQQSNGSALIRYGETVVLSTTVMDTTPVQRDFFPLTIQYEEKMYAAGKMPGGFIKREGKPSEHATLTARLIDRPLRPLFPENFNCDVQVINTVLSVDPDHSPELAAMLGSSIALGISDIPFNGPMAGVKVGYIDDQFILNPTPDQLLDSAMDLTIAGTAETINMVESSAKEVADATMVSALLFGFKAIQKICAAQQEIIAAVGQPKYDFIAPAVDETLKQEVFSLYHDTLQAAIQTKDKQVRDENIASVKDLAVAHFSTTFQDEPEQLAAVGHFVDLLEKEIVRDMIVKEKIRPDGRRLDELRPLSAQVGFLPRVHGSGLFTRGETQVLSALTLAPLSEAQTIDGLGEESQKRFLHQYNFPPYSVGETGRYGAPGRREIGHGALGEKALLPVLPTTQDFPYAIRLVAEVLSSNGSSSQASICAGTLALLDGGVPIKAPVAGIAMGLVQSEGQKVILTDIQGLEDHLGDMDFKVAGTANGITALQMDIKTDGVAKELFEAILAQAKQARLQILDVMQRTLPQPRPQLSPYAPKIVTLQIDPDQIRTVIGKGGETINKIIAETEVKIDISQDGQVAISSNDQEGIDRAIQIIKNLTLKLAVNEVYLGKVVRIESFGAFVQFVNGKDALVHISQLSPHRVAKVSDEVSLGDELLVKITKIDDRGRINASRKALLDEPIS